MTKPESAHKTFEIHKHNKKKIFLVAGRSGSGKDKLVNMMANKYNLKVLKSYTTRPKRQGEGNTHIFISEDEVSKYQGEIIAETFINGAMYFATQSQLKETDFYIIDPIGINMIRTLIDDGTLINNDEVELIVIYIYVPESTRYERAVNIRGDSEEVYFQRSLSENAQFTEFENKAAWDYFIVNTNLSAAWNKMKTILKQEGVINSEQQQ